MRRTGFLIASAVAVAVLASPNVGAQPAAAPPSLQSVSAEDQKLLARGEISHGQIVGGGVTAILVGFGVGQAVQGRWSERGWIYTLGETGSLAILIAAIVVAQNDCKSTTSNSCSGGPVPEALGAIAGVGGIVTFRVLGIVDSFATPHRQNRRIRELRMQLGGSPSVAPYVAPAPGPGGTAGVMLRF